MNTGQQLFSIAALLLLSLTILRVNNTILYSDEVMNNSKFAMMANSIATSLMEKASGVRSEGQSMHFDENTILNEVVDSTLLTPANLLGRESEKSLKTSMTTLMITTATHRKTLIMVL